MNHPAITKKKNFSLGKKKQSENFYSESGDEAVRESLSVKVERRWRRSTERWDLLGEMGRDGHHEAV